MALAIFSLLLFCGLGYPLALTLPKSLPDGFVASPVFGLALYGVVTSICYRFGADLRTALLVQTAVAGIALTYLVRREKDRLWIAAVAAATLIVAVLCILPLWVGGYHFAMFQGNVADQFNYISDSSAYAKFGYAALRDRSSGSQLFILTAIAMLDARPAIGIVLASLWPVFYSTAAEASYPFLATMQVIAGFGVLFVARNVFGAGKRLSLALMAIFAMSFFVQYIVDINAWSSLSAVSFWPVLAAMICIAMTQSSVPFMFPMAVVAAGILYLYPESSFVGVTVCAGATISSLIIISPPFHQAIKNALVLVTSLMLAVAACIPLWRGTVELLFHQMEITNQASTVITIEWFKAHGAFYSSGDRLLKPISSFEDAILYPIDLLAGLQGLYFLAPKSKAGGLLPTLGRGLEGTFVVSILATAVIALALIVRTGGARATFLIASAAALVLPAYLALSGQYWAAGKAVSMAAPFIFLICVSPLFVRRTFAMPAAVFLALQFGFGLDRIITAANGPVRGQMPYPSIPYLKLVSDWDVERWRNGLAGCKGVYLNVENATLKMLAESVVSDLGMEAAPVAGPSDVKADAHYDCEMTDKPEGKTGGRLISLER